MPNDSTEGPDSIDATTPRGQRSSTVRLAIIIAALILAPILIFQPVTHFAFVLWDDPGNVTNNPLFQPTPSDHYRLMLTKPYLRIYVPATLLMWAKLADIGTRPDGSPQVNFDPHKYHLANLVIHIFNVLLVFLILRQLLPSTLSGRAPPGDPHPTEQASPTTTGRLDADWAAGFGALLFAIHPLQVEPVAWVTSMKDVLGAFFGFLSITLYLLFAASTRRGRQYTIFFVASLAYALALLSKPTMIVIPFIVCLLEFLPALSAGETKTSARLRVPWPRLATLSVWIMLAVPIVLIALSAQEEADLNWHVPAIPIWQRPFVAGDALTFYLTKLLAPVLLAPDYGRTPTWLMDHSWAYARILVPALLIAAAWRYRRQAVWPLAALGIAGLALLPVLGLVPFDFQAFSTVADRYFYFAMLGPALAFACALMLPAARPACLTGAAILAVLAVLSITQTLFWSNTTNLFAHGLRVNPRVSAGYLQLGLATNHLDTEISDFQNGVDCSRPDGPLLSQLLVNLGVALMRKATSVGGETGLGLLRQAREDLQESIGLDGSFAPAHADLGEADFYLGRGADAAAEFHEALQLGPNDPTVYYVLAVLYAHNGRPDLARQSMQKAADLGLDSAQQALNTDPSSWE